MHGKRGPDPASLMDLRLDEIRTCWPRFAQVNQYALDAVEDILKDPNADTKSKIKAAEIVLDRVAPKKIFENLITEMLAEELKKGKKQSAAKQLLSVLMPDGKRIG